MVFCKRCDNNINDRRFITCSVCKETYHLQCANASSPRFNLMNPHRKTLWKCNPCWEHKGQTHHRDTLPDEHDYVTQRKHRINIPISNSFDSLTGTEDEDSDCSSSYKLNRNCPEVHANQSQEINELKGKNNKMNEELIIADEQMQELLNENYKLKDRVAKLENLLNNLTNTTTKNKETTSRRSKKGFFFSFFF